MCIRDRIQVGAAGLDVGAAANRRNVADIPPLFIVGIDRVEAVGNAVSVAEEKHGVSKRLAIGLAQWVL